MSTEPVDSFPTSQDKVMCGKGLLENIREIEEGKQRDIRFPKPPTGDIVLIVSKRFAAQLDNLFK